MSLTNLLFTTMMMMVIIIFMCHYTLSCFGCAGVRASVASQAPALLDGDV
jgi:hypothetical protein